MRQLPCFCICFFLWQFHAFAQELPIQVLFEVNTIFSPQYPENNSLGISSVDAALAINGVIYLRRFEKGRGSGLYIYVARVSDSVEQKSLLNSLQELPEIVLAEEDFIAFADNFPTVVPNDQHYFQQYALKNNGTFSLSPSKSGADISMEEAWAIEQGDTNIVMAVLDSGTKLDHPEFLGRIWVNPGEIPGNNQDNDNNGYIDDINGWDFINNNNTPSDDHGHGTAVAGVIASNGNNNIGFAGVDWNCKIMTLKVLNQNNSGPYSSIIEAFYYAADNGAHILNASLGGFSNSTFLHQSVIYALNQNVLSVVSTGNENSSVVRYPSAYPEVMGIGATNALDERAQPFGNNTGSNSGSNFGSHVSVVAPGNFIYSLRYTSNTNYSYRFSGTSFACPHVAGLAALLKAQDTSRTPAQIRSIIESTAEDQVGNPIEDTPGWDQYYGHGRINAFKALLAKYSTMPTLNVSTDYFEVGHPGGIHKVPYYGNRNLNSSNNNVQLAVIVIQNSDKDAQAMFRLFNNQVQSLDLSNKAVVVAPQFLDENDLFFHQLDSTFLYWAGDSASIYDGHPSLNSNASIESFAVIDSLLSVLKSSYPSLCQAVIVGSKYGGSFVQRYALLSNAENHLGIPIRYVVGNANWYTYLSNERKVSNALDQFSVPSGCSGYNTWPFGLDNRNVSNYVGSVSLDSILSRNANRELLYIIGALDTETQLSELGSGCLSASQGVNRHERGIVFSNYLGNFLGSNGSGFLQTVSLQGVGNDAAPLFSHAQSLQAIYSIPGVISSWELYDPPIHSLPPPSVFHLNDIFFTDSMVGWVAGNFRRIFYTNDGGVTWNSPVVDGTLFQELHSVHFPNQTRGFVTANNGNILRSNNGGLNWFTVTTPVNTPLRDIHMLNTSPFLTGWVVGDNGVIMYSNTGGAWSLQNSGTNQQLNAVHFTSTTHGVAVGNGGIILRTTNGGNTWQNVNSPTNSQLWDVVFTSSSVGFAVGNNGVILRTLNGGSTWSLLASPTSENLKAIDFSMNIGIAVGENGAIVRTENSGGSWSLQYSGLVRNLNGVFTHSPTNAFAVGDTSTLLQTLEGGALCFGDINLGPDTSISHLDTLVLRLPVNCFSNQNILWNTGDTGEKLVISASNYPLGHNQFFVQIETNGCIAYDTINVLIYHKDFPNAPILNLLGCDSVSGTSGITFTQSGIFVDSIFSQSGIQDSVIVHHVEINYTTEVVYQFSGCDSVIGHFGQPIYQSAVLRDTFSTVKGCDSIVIQEIQVFPSPIASVQSSTNSACIGDSIQLSADTTNAQDLEWFKDGQFISTGLNLIVNVSGNYSVIATNINGCHDTSQSVPIIFHPPPTLSFQTIPVLCSNGSPLVLNIASPVGGTYSGPGVSGGIFDPSIIGIGVHPITYTYTDSNGCVSSIQDSITVNLPPTPVFANTSNLEACFGDSIQLQLIHNVGQTYQWYKNGALIQGENQANLFVRESGNYYSIVESNSCFEYSDTLNVFIRPLPLVSISGPDTLLLCIGDSTLLQSNTGGLALSYQWFFNSNPLSGATQGVLSTSDAGQYFLMVEDPFGCVNLSETVWIFSHIQPPPTLSFQTIPVLCSNSSPLVLNIASPVGGAYSGPGVLGGSFDPSVVGIGVYPITYTYTDSNGCVSSIQDSITVNLPPTPVFANTSNLEACFGDSIQLQLIHNVGQTYQWYKNGVLIQGENQANLIVRESGNYYSIVESNFCFEYSDTLNVFIRPLPLVSISGPDTLLLCIGDSTLLQSNTGGSALSYQWFFNSNPLSGATQGVLSTSDAGQYFLMVEDPFGCVNLSQTIWIFSQNHPPAITTPSDTISICDGDTLIIQANTGVGLTYQWYQNNNILTGEIGAALQAFAGGTYQVKITENALCESMSSPLLVIVNPLPTINLSATQLNFCVGDSVLLMADSANFIYRWMFNGNTISGVGQSSVFINTPGQYSVEVTDDKGCKALSNILTIDYFSPLVNQDEICAVSFDSVGGGNRIIWEPIPGNRIKGFVIHREQGGLFDSIGYQDFATAGNFIDLSATPSSIAHSYRISTFDSCGAYSDTSRHSSVILLSSATNQLNQIDLQWTAYEGANILNYKIWRKSDGGIFLLLDSLAPGMLSYTDSFPTRGLIVYFIEADLPHVCTYDDPIDGLKSISSVLSNTIEVSSVISAENFNFSDFIHGYPNPTRGEFHISSFLKVESVTLLDFLGQTLRVQEINSQKFSIDLSQYPSGAYFIQLNGAFGAHILKLILSK